MMAAPRKQRWSQLPRAAKWGIYALGGVLVYFVVVERAIDLYQKWDMRGDAAAGVLTKYEAAGATVKRAAETLTLGVRRYGEVASPGSPEKRPLEFDRAVDAVLEKHAISGQTSTTRTAPLGSGPLPTKVGPTHRIERITKTVDFKARPEAVAAVIADLEATPVVSTVSMVQIRRTDAKDSSGDVSATLTIESWLLAKKERGR